MADENNNLFNNTNEQGDYYTPAPNSEPSVAETAAPADEQQNAPYSAPNQSEQSGQYYSAPQDNAQQYYQPQQNAQNGQYYAPQGNQQNYYQAPQGGYNPYAAPMPPQEQKANIGLAILSFFIPIVGIVLYFTQKNDKPKTAKACGKAALACIIISFILGIINFAITAFVTTKAVNDPNTSAYLDQFEDYLNDYANDNNTSTNPNLSALENTAASDAQEYLELYAFSRIGLIDQLQYDGFSESVAEKAVDSLNVDWNEQAARMAKEYLETSTFEDKQDMIDQLLYEDFTQEEAEYGASQTDLQ